MNPFLQPPRVEPRRSWAQRLVLGFNLLLITASLLVAASLGYGAQRAASVNRIALDRNLTVAPAGGGEQRVVNILLVGSDSAANLDPDDPVQIGRHGERLGDVIIVAHLDERDGTVSLLSFPRDLWVPIADTGRSDRINRAFVLGGPGTLIDTIEENFGIPIHHYVNVDFAGFRGLVEAVGSVEVYFDAPARDWNANERRTQTGFLVAEAGCHPLGPEQALAYVRSRYYQVQDPDGRWVTDPSSDLGRIRRQQEFLQRLLQKAIDRGARNPLVLRDLIDTGIRHVAIDGRLTPGLLVDLGSTYRHFDPGDLTSFTLPVADATIGTNRVLVPRLDDAEPLLALFAGARSDDPTTVAVRLVHDRSLDGDDRGVDGLVDTLLDAGFDLGAGPGERGDRPRDLRVASQAVEPGLWLRHGPGGAPAAALVARALHQPSEQAPVIVEVAGLPARTVEVALGADGAGGDRPDPGVVAGPEKASDSDEDSVTMPPAFEEGPVADPGLSGETSNGDTC